MTNMKNTETINSLAVAAAAMLLVLAALMLTSAEARYLPTRADESQAEVLKEIIRNLLNESSMSDGNAKDQMVRQSRFFANTNRAQRLLNEAYAGSESPAAALRNMQRRSAERVALDGATGGDAQLADATKQGFLKQQWRGESQLDR